MALPAFTVAARRPHKYSEVFTNSSRRVDTKEIAY